jgi:hypothetical protein
LRANLRNDFSFHHFRVPAPRFYFRAHKLIPSFHQFISFGL